MNNSPRRRPLSDNLAVALGTALSRLTGFARIVVLAWVLVPVRADGRLADVYNLANTAPNIIYDLVIGGALTATLVPRFTRALAEDDNKAISAIVSVSLLALGVLSVVATLAAPLIIRFYTSLTSAELAREYNGVATSLAYLFLPQIFFYGGTTVLSALLNAKGRFFAAAWAPVLTNIVTIAGLVVVKQSFGVITLETAIADQGLRIALGLSATLGVAAMMLALIGPVARAGFALRFRPDWRHPAIGEVVRLSTWTFGYVVANQISLAVITVIALGEESDFTAYSTMYLLLQLPHGLLAVTLMTTYTPRLTRAHLAGQTVLFRSLVRTGVRVITGLMVPVAVVFIVAPATAASVTGNFSTLDSSPGVLRGFGVGLVAFSAYLFLFRGFYAMGDTRTPFMLNAFQNGANIVVAIFLGRTWGATGLAWAFSLTYIAAAILTWIRLDRHLPGGLRPDYLLPGLLRSGVAAIPMAIAVWAFVDAADPDTYPTRVLTLAGAGTVGVACYAATLVALGGMTPGRRSAVATPRR